MSNLPPEETNGPSDAARGVHAPAAAAPSQRLGPAAGRAPAGSGGAGGADPGADPLDSLYRMSRTAGLGNQEYVAVNATSVAALLLGLTSAVAVLGWVLLVVPLITVVVAIVVMVQIRRSGGTQTGRGLAMCGLLLALGFAGAFGGQAFLEAREVAREKGDIAALIEDFGENLRKGDYEAAWEQFSPRFQQSVKKEDFIGWWQWVQNNPDWYGKVKSARWNGILHIESDPMSDTKLAMGYIIIDLENEVNPDRRPTTFRKVEGKGWTIEDMKIDFTIALPSESRGV